MRAAEYAGSHLRNDITRAVFLPSPPAGEGPGVRGKRTRALCAPIAALLAVLLTALVALSASAEEPTSPDDVQDLLFLTGDGPRLVRVHIVRGELSYQAQWGNYLVELFDRLDADDSGDLDSKEFDRGPWPQLLGASIQIRNQLGQPIANANRQMSFLDFDSIEEDDRISFNEFVQLLAHLCGSVNYSQGAQNDDTPLSAVGKQLDANGDGRLSVEEASEPYERLRRLDSNDDETLSQIELMPDASPVMAFQRRFRSANARTQAPKTPVVGPPPGASTRDAAQGVIAYYDRAAEESKPGDGLLAPDEIPIPADEFQAHDKSGDGRLDANEVAEWLAAHRPDAELRATIPDKTGTAAKVELIDSGAVDAAAGAVHAPEVTKTDDGSAVTLRWLATEIEIRGSSPTDPSQQVESFKQFFKQIDSDNNGYLDTNETRNRLGQQAFAQMDEDGNGMVFEQEFLDYQRRAIELSQNRTQAQISDSGSNLFAALDKNGDSRLGVRELRTLAGKLSAWDRKGQGSVGPDELPRRFQVNVGPAESSGVFNSFVAVSLDMVSPAPQTAAQDVPAWFTAMDRNRDGDISRREFLGRRDVFDRLDADSDGLIDPQEAAAAKKDESP